MFRLLTISILALPWLTGCASLINYSRAKHDEHGLTLILPGIESANYQHWKIANGLDDAGVKTTIEVYDWTMGTPATMLFHLRDIGRNRRQAALLAQRITRYQDEYPGRPVHLIGHSGGGAMTLLTLEALPSDRRVTTATLLAPAISPDYPLGKALSHSEHGIWHYSSMGDIPLLMAGTTVFGTVDGKHTPAAGAFGFEIPRNTSEYDRKLYAEKLHEVPYDLKMLRDWNVGGHTGALTRWFAKDYLSKPILESQVQMADLSANEINR